jgi:hypothetical protein
MTNSDADQQLIDVLEQALPQARQWLEYWERQEESLIWLPRPTPHMDEISVPIQAALASHPVFKDDINRFFGSKQLMRHPWWTSRPLLIQAVKTGPRAAVDWYYRVHSTRRASIRYVAEVFGLAIDGPVALSNGVMLVPLNQLPLSANTKHTQARFSGRPHTPLPEPMSIPIGAVLEISDVEASVQYEDGVSLHAPRSRTINRTIMVIHPDQECRSRCWQGMDRFC